MIAALPSFFWIAAILAVNNTCDIEGDRLAGRKTWSVITGQRVGELTVILLGLGAQISGILAGLYGYLPRLTSVTMLAGSLPIALVIAIDAPIRFLARDQGAEYEADTPVPPARHRVAGMRLHIVIARY